MHWADAATLDLLAYLGTKLNRMRVLVVASFRSDELQPDHLDGARSQDGAATRRPDGSTSRR